MKYQPYIPSVVSLAIWFLAELFLFQPKFFYSAVMLAVLLIILSIKYINNKKYWLSFTIFPLLFLLSFFFYAAIVVSHFWIQIIYLLIVFFIFLYLHNFYYYSIELNQADGELSWVARIENLLVSGGFLIAFASAAVLLRMSAFIAWPLYIMLPIWAIIVWLLLVQFQPWKPKGFWPVKSLIPINVLILTELAGIFALLPLNFNILALALAIIYYLSLMIIRLAQNNGLNRRALKLPLILSGIAIFFLFLTARWL